MHQIQHDESSLLSRLFTSPIVHGAESNSRTASVTIETTDGVTTVGGVPLFHGKDRCRPASFTNYERSACIKQISYNILQVVFHPCMARPTSLADFERFACITQTSYTSLQPICEFAAYMLTVFQMLMRTLPLARMHYQQLLI
jgi:hypothetical protein